MVVRFLMLLSLLATPAAFADGQDSIIRVDGFGPLRIGMSKADLDASGLQVEYGMANEGEVGTDCTYVSIAGYKLSGLMEKNVLARIYFNDPTYRTQTGIRVGDPEKKVRAAYGKALKVEQHAYSDGHYLYLLNKQGAGLLFETDRGIISSISTGKTPQINYIEGCL